MRKNGTLYLITFCVLGASLALSGCGGSSEKGQVLAKIGSSRITVSDFNERMANLPERYRKIVSKRKDEFLQELISDTLLYKEALRKGLHRDKDVKKVIEEARKKILISRLLQDEVNDKIVITDEDIRGFYDSNSDKFMTPEIMRVSHILVPTREDADKIERELSKGAPFDELARAKSVDPTAQRGGDIGYFPKGQLMTEFEDACSGLEVGQVSAPVKTKLGYHIIKLTDRRAPELMPIDQVKDNIRARLRAVKRQELFNELTSGLRDETVVEVNEEALAGVSGQPDEEKGQDK